MIELNGQTYPSEVRQSQPVPLENQEAPAGSSEFPGVTESLGLHREVIAGQVIGTADPLPDLTALRSSSLSSVGLGFVPSLASTPGALRGGEIIDGTLSDPAGDGAAHPRTPETPPILQADDLAWQPGERETAAALLLEMQTISSEAKVQRFVRYPDDRRVMLVFAVAEETRSLQQQY